jgi:hypothetical protein
MAAEVFSSAPLPKVIVPMHSGDTRMPVDPSGLYSMMFSCVSYVSFN